MNAKRVERIWREGLTVPQLQPERGCPWLADGSCVRLRPERANHVWAQDVVEDRAHDGRRFRILSVLDEVTRESLGIVVARRLSSEDVQAAVTELVIGRGPPEHIRPDQGPEFIAMVVKDWLGRRGAATL